MTGRVLLRAFHRLGAVGTRTWQPVMAPVVSQVGECHRRQSQPSQCLLFRGYSAAAEQFDLINIQDSTHFQRDVLENATPVVVDFHATWCGPCKLLAPRLESIIGGKSGKVVLAKVDVDENPELAMKYGVKSVPTVLGVRKGEVLDQFIGCKEDDELETFVEKLIN